jgi:large subunit ribosomal protein L6
MSRIGRKPIPIPKQVEVTISDSSLSVKGPQGLLKSPVPTGISFSIEGSELICKRSSDARQQRAYHGLARALAQNAVKGVSEGFKK